MELVSSSRLVVVAEEGVLEVGLCKLIAIYAIEKINSNL